MSVSMLNRDMLEDRGGVVGTVNGHDAHPIVTSFFSCFCIVDFFRTVYSMEQLVLVYTKLQGHVTNSENDLLSGRT
jgi:hypothetical protein